MKLVSSILGPEKEKFRKGKGVGMWGQGDRQEGQSEERSRERQRNKYTNLDPKAWGKSQRQTWTQRRGEDLRDQGPDSERVRSPQRVAHKEQGKWKHEEYHT